MAITQSQYTAPDKVQGDIFYSDEHNEMKDVLNQKTDAANAILIEGNQVIAGDLTMQIVTGTDGNFTGQVTITADQDHLKFISARTDGNTSLDRTSILMTNADSSLDFQLYSVTDGVNKFTVDTTGSAWFANKLDTQGTVTILHRAVTDEPKALIINSGATPTTTPSDIIWSRDSKEAGRVRFDDKFDMYLATLNNSNILTNRIGLGSQRGTGLNHGVTLYDGDTGIKSLHTVSNGFTVPTPNYDGSGVQILSKTLNGEVGDNTGNACGSIFFKETNLDTYGLAFEYYGLSTNKLVLNRYNNSTTGIPIIDFNRTDSNVEIYGNLWAGMAHVSTGVLTHREWFKNYGWAHNSGTEGKLVIQMDGTLILAAGDKAGGQVASNIATPETLHMVADNGLQFYSNLQSGWASKKSMFFANNGNLTVEGAVYATNFQFTSDITEKENIQPLTTTINVPFIEYNFKGSKTKRYGVSAQEVQADLPELVSEDSEGKLTVAMIDLLVLKVAELERKVNELTR
jgi:hypothetical protein